MLDGHAGELVEQAALHQADHEVTGGFALDGDARPDEIVAAGQLGLLKGHARDALQLERDTGAAFAAVGGNDDGLDTVLCGFFGHAEGNTAAPWGTIDYR